VATADAKLIRYLDLKGPDGAPLMELYRLDRDPTERRNVVDAADARELRERMVAELERVRGEQSRPPTP
jgi:hypothetical protein